MSNIIGTTVTIRDFFDSTKELNIIAGHNYGSDEDITKTITFKTNRKYIIPKYQREIRWEAEHVKVLINDLELKSEFIGNIILNSKINDFEIIDGQQRITVLLMIIDYIQKNIFDKYTIDLLQPCEIVLESFIEFNKFRDRDYGTAYKDDNEKKDITKPYNDLLLQSERYAELWKCIQKIFANDNKKMAVVFNNLYKCNINLLIFEAESNPQNVINYFLDVNQKGVKLDDEDILKGYLFHYNVKQVNERWIKIKQNCCWINKNGKCYSLMQLFEQYFYACRNLLDDSKMKIPDIKKDLTLRYNWEDFPSGTHLVVALENKTKILEHLDRIVAISQILYDISINSNPTNEFLELFSRSDQYDTRTFIFYLCKAILLSKNELPKAYLIKYILDNFVEDNNDHKNRDSIKVVYIYTLLFNLFSDITKKREHVYKYARQDDWEKELSKQINKYFNSTESTFVQKNAFVHLYQNMEEEPENNRRDCFEFQAFACIYSFLCKTPNGLYSIGESQEKLYDFILNSRTDYTLEHFLLNGSKKYVVEEGEKEKNYPKCIGKYVGGLFNFIYVPKCVNSEILKDYIMPVKVELLCKEGKAYDSLDGDKRVILDENPIKCSYSKMVIELLSRKDEDNHHLYFDKYWDCYYKNNASEWERYFSKTYMEEYFQFTEKILELFKNRFKSLKQEEGDTNNIII